MWYLRYTYRVFNGGPIREANIRLNITDMHAIEEAARVALIECEKGIGVEKQNARLVWIQPLPLD
jgi:hypothetical protein